MPKFFTILGTTCVLSLASVSAQQPVTTGSATAVSPEAPAPIEPPITVPSVPTTTTETATEPAPAAAATEPATTNITAVGGSGPNSRSLTEFQGDDIAQVLRLLARQAHVTLMVSDKIEQSQPPIKVTARIENKSALDTIKLIAENKNLVLTEREGVYQIKTKEEQEAEPTESAFYTFSYASAEKVTPLLTAQLQSKATPPQFDARTNTVFYREARSNMDRIKLFLETIDCPTKQVMIEARLVEVTANPKQSYGINWAGVVGGSTSPQTFRYGGSTIATGKIQTDTNPSTGQSTTSVVPGTLPTIVTNANGNFTPQDFLRNGQAGIGGLLNAASGQVAILSAPAMSLTMRLLNEDSDAEFLANPRVVTANNQQATIKITRNQPVPQLNFNEQTATAVFGGFQDKEFGNTLVVTPSINKDSFVTMSVKPEISNKVGDSVFNFAGATVTSPIIDKRNLESNVLIKSGDTLAIGGLLQDEVTKSTTKVPVLGDIPVIGYAFQEHVNSRTKRNLLVFVTPTIIKQGYGTGLEDQVSGLHHSGEEYADPNGWRNNAKGAVRLVPTSERQVAADYPKPGTPLQPEKTRVSYKTSAFDREK